MLRHFLNIVVLYINGDRQDKSIIFYFQNNLLSNSYSLNLGIY